MSEHSPKGKKEKDSSDNRRAGRRIPKKKGAVEGAQAELAEVLNGGQVKEVAPPAAVPVELKQIFGDAVPAEALAIYNKLLGREKRDSYVAKLTAEEGERKERRDVEAVQKLKRVVTHAFGGIMAAAPQEDFAQFTSIQTKIDAALLAGTEKLLSEHYIRSKSLSGRAFPGCRREIRSSECG